MFCAQCGKPVADGARFCGHCGATVAAPATPPAEPAFTPPPPAAAAPSATFGNPGAGGTFGPTGTLPPPGATPGASAHGLVARVKGILLSPRTEWPVIAAEPRSARDIYLGYVAGEPWFEARLTGHVDFAAAGLTRRDEIWLYGEPPLHLRLDPGLDAQATVTAVLANSLARVRAAPPGWLTIADLPPARPA